MVHGAPHPLGANATADQGQTLAGIVEADETYVGGKMTTFPQAVKPGKRPMDRLPATANKKPVLAVLQRGGSARSQYIEKVSAMNVRPIIQEMLAENAHLMTHTSTAPESAGAIRRYPQVNHNIGEYSRRENGVRASTNTAESFFAIVKRGHYGVYHHRNRQYMPQYLQDFDWRYNVRKIPDAERANTVLKKSKGKRLTLRPPAPGTK